MISLPSDSLKGRLFSVLIAACLAGMALAEPAADSNASLEARQVAQPGAAVNPIFSGISGTTTGNIGTGSISDIGSTIPMPVPVPVPIAIPGSAGTIGSAIGSVGTDIIGSVIGSAVPGSVGSIGSAISDPSVAISPIMGVPDLASVGGVIGQGNPFAGGGPGFGSVAANAPQGGVQAISSVANSDTVQNAATKAINSVTQLADITTGGGGIEIWGNFAKAIRKALRGGEFGVPKGLVKPNNGGFDIQAARSAYLFTFVLIAIFFLLAVFSVPILIVNCCCCLSRKKRTDLKKSFFRWICAFITVIIVSAAAAVGFITGIRGNTLLASALDNFQHSIDVTINDTLDIVTVFPQVMTTSLASVNSGIIGVTFQTTGALKTSEIPNMIGSLTDTESSAGSFNAAIQPLISVLKDVKVFGAEADDKASIFLERARVVRTGLTGLRTAITALNAQQTFSGVTFKRSTDYIFDNDLFNKFDTLVTKLQDANSIFNNINAAYGFTGFYEIDEYINDAEAIQARVANLAAAVTAAMVTKTQTVSVVLSSELKKKTNQIQSDADRSSSDLKNTLRDADKQVDDIFKASAPGGIVRNYLQRFFFFLFVFGVAVAGLVLILIMFRTPTCLKGLSPLVVLSAILFLVFAGIFLLLTVFFADFCGLADLVQGTGPEASTLWGTSFEYLPKLFYHRENSCLKEDKGLVQFGYKMGAFPDTVANITIAIAPTINSFDLSALASIASSEFWMTNTKVAVDTMSVPLNFFLGMSAIRPWRDIVAVDLSGTPQAALQTLTDQFVAETADITQKSASTSAPPQFTVTTGTLTYDVVARSPYFNRLQQVSTDAGALVTALNDFLTPFKPFAAKFKNVVDNGGNAANQAMRLPGLYNTLSTNIDNYATYETNNNLNPFQQTLKSRMLSSVEASRKQFEAGLPCKTLAKDTKVMQDSICLAMLTSTDALWLSFAAIGLGLFIYLPCYGCLVNRLANGKRRGKRGKVDPEGGKGVDSY